MVEMIQYQNPLPYGYRLRYINDDDTVRITRDSVGKTLLWAEAFVPSALLILFAALAVMIWRWTHESHHLPGNLAPLLIFEYGVLLGTTVIIGRTARINMGIVVEIAVSPGMLYWRKRNIWGDKEYFWPLSSIRSVRVENNLLRVHRFRGPALAAFSFVKSDERAYAAVLLNEAIERQSHPQSP
jgi:hypothetical protein